MAGCATFEALRKAGKIRAGHGCPDNKTCDGTICRLPEAQEVVHVLSPDIEEPVDHQQNNAAANALLTYLKQG